MRRRVHVLCGLVLVGLAVDGGRAADDAKGEIDGTWDLVELEAKGKKYKATELGAKLTATGDKFVIKRGGTVNAEGTYKFDPSKKPKAVDITYSEGPSKGKTFKAIYEVEGDTLKICRTNSPAEERPTGFETSKDKGGHLSVYKRVKR